MAGSTLPAIVLPEYPVMSGPLLIIGSYLSPYVRKTLALLEHKGIAYQIDPIVPFYGNHEFARLSPLRQIPVLVDGDFVLNDSSVICQYLEERYPQSPLYPSDIGPRAQARWLEEYADSHMGQVIIWQLFNQLVINRGVWGKTPDQALLERTYREDLPTICSYLESRLADRAWLCGEFSIADLSVAAMFRNAQLARYAPDPQRWPQLAAYIENALALPAFVHLARFENLCIQTPVAAQRDALQAAGAPLSPHTLFRPEPQRGPMSR